MASGGWAYIWTMRAVFALLACVILLIHLLPLETQTRNWVSPDFLFALTLAWGLRRPDFVPPLLVAAVFLMADLLLQRPPGLFAAVGLIAVEVARRRHEDIRETVFVFEVITAVALIVAVYMAYLAIWSVAAPYPVSYGLIFQQIVLTSLSYPVAAGMSHLVFRIRLVTRGEVDERGQRL